MIRELIDNESVQSLALVKKDEQVQFFISGILNLNQARRDYFQDYPANKVKGVHVLESTSHTADGLFLHLRENPALCCKASRKKKGAAYLRKLCLVVYASYINFQ
jgi:hypothetical protein